jgi:putative ABC transport system permease protein
MLVRALPYRDAERLVMIGNTIPDREWLEGREGVQQLEMIAPPNFRDLRERVRGLEATAMIERRSWLSAAPDAPAELLDVANVEHGFFDLLSVRPLLGRLPRDGDQASGGGQWGAAISYEGWQRRFGGDPAVLGKRFGVFEVIGVLPRDFLQPAALVGSDVEFWVHLDPNDRRYIDRRRRDVMVLARLAPDVPFTTIRRDLSSAQVTLAAEHPETNRSLDGRSLGVGVNTLRDATVGAGQRPVLIFLGAALLLLVLAGTNAANLLLVRGLERDGELALRRALGARRSRLAMNLVTESVALSLAGGVIGLGIAAIGVAAFRELGPQELPRMSEIAVNLRIVAAGAILSLLVGLVVGVMPAIRSSGADLLANLRASLTASAPRGTRLRTALAATQLALALMLGVGASLLFRSFVHLRSEPHGFESRGAVAFVVAFKKPRPWETWDQVLDVVRALPGVTSVGAASNLPFQTPSMAFRIGPAEMDAGTAITAVSTYAVDPTFFATARIPMRRGRTFDASDQPESKRVAIVNERFAESYFGSRDPVGQHLVFRDDGANQTPIEIIGVVGNVVQARVEDGVRPALYMPHTQMPAPMQVLATTLRDPAQFERELRQSLARVGLWNAPVFNVSTMESRIVASLAAPRFQMLLIGAFAGAAILLAAIGLYGTLAFTVRARMRELGIRMAMGASRRQIFELVLRQGALVLGTGLGVGLLGALSLTRVLEMFLYRVSPIDPLAFLGAVGVVVVAVVIATVRPARRASRVDPLASIRA